MTDLRALLAPIHDLVQEQRVIVMLAEPDTYDTRPLDAMTRLLAAIEAVGALHKPEKRWEPYEGAGYTFLTREQALEAAGEEDLGAVAMEAGPQFFEVCAECARVESEQLSESGEEWGYREALWPCKTTETFAAALGSDTTNQEGTQ
ncbi:hypothetical protein ACLRGI_04885 [Paenarthrobacter nitroguajacolicus]|uniref:hypothetical protein n=1 Tax=Paenarthrobacter nitroguajacolicus TaxID=211146 RepID=UPI003ADC4580